jgi:integrase
MRLLSFNPVGICIGTLKVLGSDPHKTRRIMMLTEKAILALKSREKVYRVSDGKVKCLCLEVRPTGSKLWRLRYQNIKGKSTMMSLGEYPVITLARARELALEKKRLKSRGIDISRSHDTRFNKVVEDWLKRNKTHWTPYYHKKVKERLDLNVLPFTNGMDIKDIQGPHLISIMQRILQRGALNTAHKTYQYLVKIFSWAIVMDLTVKNPAMDIKGYLSPLKKKRYPALTNLKEVASIIMNIDNYSGSFVTTKALQLLVLTMLRPGEVRKAEWSEVNWTEKTLNIPAAKMKMKRDHMVFLSDQAIDVLKEIHQLTGHRKYIFPGEKTSTVPMSEGAMLGALRRMGYSKDELVAHSFRSISSTILHEAGWDRDWIEMQLAHVPRGVRGIYNRAEYVDQRRCMLQAWADFVDYLRKEKSPDMSSLKYRDRPEIGVVKRSR